MELAMLHGIQAALQSPFMDTFMQVCTMLGENGALWIVLAILMYVSGKHKDYAVMMIIAMAATYLIGDVVIKNLVARPRPFVDDPSIILLITAPNGYSFPSGHTSISFAALTVLMASRMRPVYKGCFTVAALLIAFSRLYLCVHYPSDVLAGAALGILIGVLTVVFARRYLQQKRMGLEKKAD